ncbi:Cytochrome P450 4c3 [Armadillidium nasatum]|uniref:Cytochrome P450 4c3 n=1 Tax=Armadillidium nasatum TaxID=96803 RepID=A0A5N5TDN8_9CRUS|nr:Cytochrome P450 4c3 [Armadillidium nasatum]
MWIMHKPYVFIYGASGVEAILNNSRNLVKGTDYGQLHSWIGLGLLTSSGSKWHTRRKILTPAFHFKILEDFIEIFNQQSQKFVTKLQKYSDGKSFDIFPLITLNQPWEERFAQDDPHSDYVTAVHEHLNVLHAFASDTIRERRKEYKQLKAKRKDKSEDEIIGKKKRQAFLDLLIEYLEEGETLTEEDIREEVETFMFEGHDTTASGITWTVYLLGQHPEIQEKVYDELESIFGKSERPATSEDIREMNYLECCIKESLRLLPPVPIFVRNLTEDLIIDGYIVPRGTDVSIFTYNLHRDPKHFPDPLKFQPERFFPEISAKRNPYAFVPFSAGPRNCIGQKFALMEEKVILSTFLRKYKVESLETMEDLKVTGDIIFTSS